MNAMVTGILIEEAEKPGFTILVDLISVVIPEGYESLSFAHGSTATVSKMWMLSIAQKKTPGISRGL
jgi:hypothetical protein